MTSHPRARCTAIGAGIADLAQAEPDQFEEALTAARDEGNQSRANVVSSV